MATLTHELLTDYADTFCTYGNLSNPVWFLGLEECGGADLEAASRKVLAWEGSGRRRSVGLIDPESDFLRTAGKPAELQKTWSNQLRVLLGMYGEPLDNDRIRYLQTREHGQLDGPTCLMELFPLPCRNAGAWVYGEVAHDAAPNEPNVFATKKAYRTHYLPKRLEKIASLVEEYGPDALICTSWTDRDPILSLLDDVRTPELGLTNARRQAVIGRLHDTVVAVCSHPADRVGGPQNEFYHALGGAIAERMKPGGHLKLVA